MNSSTSVVRSLDLALLAFARKQLRNDHQKWYLVGNKCFSEDATKEIVAPGYIAIRGYTLGLKSCLAGLTLVSDMTVSVFLSGGPLINIVMDVCGFNNSQRFLDETRRYGINERQKSQVEKVMKNCKIRVDHLVLFVDSFIYVLCLYF